MSRAKHVVLALAMVLAAGLAPLPEAKRGWRMVNNLPG